MAVDQMLYGSRKIIGVKSLGKPRDRVEKESKQTNFTVNDIMKPNTLYANEK